MAEEKESMVEEVTKDEGGSSSAMRFEIKKWNAVTMWSWDICADTCAICRNSLNEPSIEYQVRFVVVVVYVVLNSLDVRLILLLITKMV